MNITCVVCGNCITNTKLTRPELIYHQFPSNPCSRKEWLKVYGIDHVYEWQRVCSDHFLKEHYRQENEPFLFENAIPQPYDQSCNGNGFLYNSTTQSNDMQVDDDTCLPIEQNRLREEQHIENGVANNLVPPKPSRKQTNDDMPSIQAKRFKKQIPDDQFIANDNIQTVIESVVEPVTTITEDVEDNEFDDFIFEVSKMIELPSLFWDSVFVKERYETTFYQKDSIETLIVKKVCFCNSLVPRITIYDKEYKFHILIRSKRMLELLLEIINNIEKCFGMDEKFINFFQESYLEFGEQMEMSGKIPTQKEMISYYSKKLQNFPEPLIL